MRYVFLVSINGGQTEVGFFADSEDQAREKCTDWLEGNGSIITLKEVWSNE